MVGQDRRIGGSKLITQSQKIRDTNPESSTFPLLLSLTISSFSSITPTNQFPSMAAAATMATVSIKCSMRLSNSMINPTPKAIITACSKQPSPSSGLINSKWLEHIAPRTVGGAFFAALSTCEPAMAAQQVAEIAEGDNRGLALLLPIIPAIAWVLFNILQPALNQINRMRSDKALVVGLGLGLAGYFFATPHAHAGDMLAELAAAAPSGGGDNRGQLLLFVVLPAIAWVLYNILQPALNQLNRMRSDQ